MPLQAVLEVGLSMASLTDILHVLFIQQLYKE